MKTFNNAFELLTDDPKELEYYQKKSDLINKMRDLQEEKNFSNYTIEELEGIIEILEG